VRSVLDLPVATGGEQGLLGIAASPNFAADNLLYLYHTAAAVDGGTPISNSVSRYRWDGANLMFDRRIIDLPGGPGPNHNGGRLAFGPDGKLYIGIGDLNRNERTSNYRDSSIVNRIGAILRVNADGSSIPTNPFYSAANIGTANEALNDIFAYGIRNSFGMGFDPVSGDLWMSDNGPGSFDEINRVRPGFNGGWERIMGPTDRNGGSTGPLASLGERAYYSDPRFSWLTPVAPTDVHFLENARLGAQYKNDMFVGSLHGGKIYNFDLSPSRLTLALDGPLADLVADNSTSNRFAEQGAILFGSDFGTITDIFTGPGGLYVVSLNGQIYRITTRPDGVQMAAMSMAIPEPGVAVFVCVLGLMLLRRGSRITVYFNAPTSRQRLDKQLAIPLRLHAAVEDHHDPPISLAADEPAEALLELDHRFGHRVFHERVAAAALDRVKAGFDDGLIRHSEGELDDDDIAELIALHVDPLPEAAGAEEDRVLTRSKPLEQHPPRGALALDEQRVAELFDLSLQAVGGFDEHLVAREQHERPAIGLLQVVQNLLTRRRKKAAAVARLGEIGFDIERRLLFVIKRRAQLQRPRLIEPQPSGDVGEGGRDTSRRGTGYQPVLLCFRIAQDQRVDQRFISSLPLPVIKSRRLCVPMHILHLVPQIAFIAYQVIVILCCPKRALP